MVLTTEMVHLSQTGTKTVRSTALQIAVMVDATMKGQLVNLLKK